jgi:hypothetical protein
MTFTLQDQDIKDWSNYIEQLRNGYHMADHDWKECIRLNHLVGETVNDIHNTNMLKGMEGIK